MIIIIATTITTIIATITMSLENLMIKAMMS
jgi:hypothetical protein